MNSIFTKIIDREIPAHIVFEDEYTLAFLDINPVQPGHTLVVSKLEVNHLQDLDDEHYTALMMTVKRLATHFKHVLGTERVCLKVEGFDVQHVHVHLIPANTAAEFKAEPTTADPEDLEAMAQRLRP